MNTKRNLRAVRALQNILYRQLKTSPVCKTHEFLTPQTLKIGFRRKGRVALAKKSFRYYTQIHFIKAYYGFNSQAYIIITSVLQLQPIKVLPLSRRKVVRSHREISLYNVSEFSLILREISPRPILQKNQVNCSQDY